MIGHLNKYYLEGRRDEVSTIIHISQTREIFGHFMVEIMFILSLFRCDYGGFVLS